MKIFLMLAIVATCKIGSCASEMCTILDRIEHGKISSRDDLVSVTELIAEHPQHEAAFIASIQAVRKYGSLRTAFSASSHQELLSKLESWCNDPDISSKSKIGRQILCVNGLASSYQSFTPEQLTFLEVIKNDLQLSNSSEFKALTVMSLLNWELAHLNSIAIKNATKPAEFWNRFSQVCGLALRDQKAETVAQVWTHVVAINQALQAKVPISVTDSGGRLFIRPWDPEQTTIHVLDGLAIALQHLERLNSLGNLNPVCNRNPTKVLVQLKLLGYARLAGDYNTIVSLGEALLPLANELSTEVVVFLYEETGYAYYHAYANYPRALELYQKALKLAPNDTDLPGKIDLCKRDMEEGVTLKSRPQTFYY